ncbi:hypothetical protein D3OALGA1CA_3781 [Olavius algarvensis associated proteobacterium Delta 3]|nr:hypothetical protein D3OALGA1CA_3781 [Olavius algarvensis associated proteobacterium Delta 3]CAB5149911.1 hypothetical protein D3OALGB2SA_4740 [Olavius algarvensis associated proteobacterium Delta 3]
MADHIGIVIKTDSNNYAHVVTDRKGACGGCQSTPGGCRSCLASAKMESRVANPIGAEAGDLVNVRLASANLFTGAAIMYLMPVVLKEVLADYRSTGLQQGVRRRNMKAPNV